MDNALIPARRTAAHLTRIVERARVALPGRRGSSLGIAGGPGVGKSTIATEVVALARGTEAAYVPMDGFHMRHAKLEALGTVEGQGRAAHVRGRRPSPSSSSA